MKRLIKLIICLAPAVVFAQKITIGSGAELNIVGQNSTNPSYTTTVACAGDFEVQGVLDLDYNATLILGGDFISSTSGNNIQRGNSTVIFNGTAAQNITRGIASNSSFGFYNLTLNNAAGLTLDPTYIPSLTVYNVLTPQLGTFTTGDVLVINALNPTNYGKIAYGNGSFSGQVIIEKDLSGTAAGWRHLAMPFGGAGDTWSSIVKTDINLLLADHATANQINCKSWDATASGSADYATGWVPTPTTSSFTTAVSAYLDASVSLHAVSAMFSLKGTLHAQTNIPFALAYTRDPADGTGTNTAAVGWNFIPNPWPALLDVDALLNDVDFEPTYKAIHVFNAITGTSQAILRNNAVTKVNYNAPDPSIEDASVNIPPLQSFWVKADQHGQSITLKAATMQTVEQPNAANGTFMKQPVPLLRLNAFDADSLWDQLVVYFDAASSRYFDLAGDAYYFPSQNSTIPVFYATEGKEKASIVSRAPIGADSVEIAFGATNTHGPCYVHADLDALPSDWHVYLRDRKTRKTIKLAHNTSVAFTHSFGISTKRFVLYYTKQSHDFDYLVTGEQAEILVRVAQNQLSIESYGITGHGTVRIYDAIGKLHYAEKHFIATSQRIPLALSPAERLLFVEVHVNGQYVVQKVFF